MKTNINQARCLTLLIGLLASFGSIAIFLNPIDSFKSFTLVLGYLTLFMGITKTLRYFTSSVFTSELPLFKGIINIIFGLIIIFNTELTLVTILFLIG